MNTSAVEARTLHGLGFGYVKRMARVKIDKDGLRSVKLALGRC